MRKREDISPDANQKETVKLMHAGNFQMTLMWPRLKISFPFERPTCLNVSDHRQLLVLSQRRREWRRNNRAGVFTPSTNRCSQEVRTEARTRRHASKISEHESTSWTNRREERRERERERETEREREVRGQRRINHSAFQNRKVCKTPETWIKSCPAEPNHLLQFSWTSDATRHKGALQRRLLRTPTNHVRLIAGS